MSTKNLKRGPETLNNVIHYVGFNHIHDLYERSLQTIIDIMCV